MDSLNAPLQPLDLDAIRESFIENGYIDARVVALISEIKRLRTPQATGKPAAGLDLDKMWRWFNAGDKRSITNAYGRMLIDEVRHLRDSLASPSPVTAAASAEASYQAWLKRAGYFDTPDLKEGYLAAYADASVAPVPTSTDAEGMITPKGWVKLNAEVYRHGEALTILGTPDNEEDSDNPKHDCDAMGCRWQHVIAHARMNDTPLADQPGSESTGPALTVEKVRDTLHKAAPGSNELLAQCRDHALQPPSEIRLGAPGAAPKGREETV